MFKKKYKLIFLDIDGVLNVIPQGYDEFGAIFHEHLVDNLALIIEQTDADIIISSSWRADGVDRFKKMWRKRELPGRIIGITPFSDDRHRGKEIQKWFDVVLDKKRKEIEIESYCIIDDDSDFLDHQFKNHVKTSGNSDHPDCIDIGYGLTLQCAEKAISILKNNLSGRIFIKNK